ncbi:MAG: hypothetical protein DRI48_07050 [Chloroflexi bacterium]|nr:MAG: hypothetical protein DRI48_07050 [Chloroflexota bacterium]
MGIAGGDAPPFPVPLEAPLFDDQRVIFVAHSGFPLLDVVAEATGEQLVRRSAGLDLQFARSKADLDGGRICSGEGNGLPFVPHLSNL